MSVLPAEWLVDVVVLRGGGRDPRGNPRPEQRIELAGVAVGWRSTADPVDRDDVTSDFAVLYDETGELDWLESDRVELPADNRGPRGVWQVDGRPKAWPVGWEVPLRRAT